MSNQDTKTAEDKVDDLHQQVNAPEVEEAPSAPSKNTISDDAEELLDAENSSADVHDNAIMEDDAVAGVGRHDNDDLASSEDIIEDLTNILLDGAGAANEAAQLTNQSIQTLSNSVNTIDRMIKDLRKTNIYILVGLAIVSSLALISAGVMVNLLQSATKDATAISVAMATKMVEFDRNFASQLERIGRLEAQLIDVADTGYTLGMRIEQATQSMHEAGSLTQQVVATQATQNQAILGDVSTQIADNFSQLQKVSKQQEAMLSSLRERITSLEMQMQKTRDQDLVGKLKALISLEQQRYYELEREKLEQQQKMLAVQQAMAAEGNSVTDTFITYGIETDINN